MKPAIEIKNLGKQYMLQEAPPYIALRDVISQPLKKLFNPAASKVNTFWALQDINLSIEPGERVGIIGRNGAGKSTLLKIISRITPPSTGEAFIRGRVGSLLEVGTGFHPELTGRENIYLNGSILGLKKAEINRQLEAIIDFSGVEKFIDSPLKHYSSGMQLRLAFSVAAHLEPEILLIDEVLAVGDMAFQKKCIAKMEEVSRKNGKTILFISHQLSAVRQLCNTAVLLNEGQVVYAGTVDETIQNYTSKMAVEDGRKFSGFGENGLLQEARLITPLIEPGTDLRFIIQLNQHYLKRDIVINFNLYNHLGDFYAHLLNEDDGFSTSKLNNQPLQVTIMNLNLTPGTYYLSFWAGVDNENKLESHERILEFTVTENHSFSKRLSTYPAHAKNLFKTKWDLL